MEQEPQMNIHKRKSITHLLCHLPSQPSLARSCEPQGGLTRMSPRERSQRPTAQCQTWSFGTPDLKRWNILLVSTFKTRVSAIAKWHTEMKIARPSKQLRGQG